MQLVKSQNLLAPSVCIICEESPDGDVIDTLRPINVGVASYLNGRKYVCQRCAGEFAKLLNFEKGEDVETAKISAVEAENALANFRAHAAELAKAITDLAEHPGAGEEKSPVEVKETPAKSRVDKVNDISTPANAKGATSSKKE